MSEPRAAVWTPGTALRFADRRVYSCPVDDCHWSYEEGLPAWTGPDTILESITDNFRRTEDALSSHLASHPVTDFVRTIVRLRRIEAEAS